MGDGNSENNPPTSDLTEIDEVTRDYSRYLEVDAAKERQVFYDSIEEMLTKLDEFGGLVDMVRSDTGLCVNKTVPEIQAKCEDMKQIFTRIDQLEVFVAMVKKNVGEIEEQVNTAENDMGSFSGFKKMFSSLIGTRKPQNKDPGESYKPPEIFVTEEYLKPVLPVTMVMQDSPVTTTTQDSPVSMATQDSPVSMATQDSPVSMATQDSPVSMATQPAEQTVETDTLSESLSQPNS